MEPILPTLQSMDTIKKQKAYLKHVLDKQKTDIFEKIYFIPLKVLNEENSFEIKANFKNLDYNEAIQECLNALKDKILTIHGTSTKFTDGLIPVGYVGPLLFNVESTALLSNLVQYSLKGMFSISIIEQSISVIEQKEEKLVETSIEKEAPVEKESTNDNVGARILETVKNHMRTENLKEDLEKFEFVAKNNITKSELERILELRGSLWGTPIFPNAVKDNAEDKEFDDAFENLRKPAENPTSNKYQKKESNWANSSMRLIEETVIQGLVDLDNKRADYIEGASAFGINLK